MAGALLLLFALRTLAATVWTGPALLFRDVESKVIAAAPIIQCQASWLDGVNRFRAGDTATVDISLFDMYGNRISKNTDAGGLDFSLRVNGRKGESMYISNISIIVDHGNVSIKFMPCLVGVFSLQVENSGQEIQNSPLPFSVTPGNISIHASFGSWLDGINNTKPGQELKLNILLRDAFMNRIISTTNETALALFIPKIVDNEGQYTKIMDFKVVVSKVAGNVALSFSPTMTGKQWLLVGQHGNNSEYLFNSPLPFFVEDGPLSPIHTYAKWKYKVNIFPPDKGVKLYVFQRDKWGNAVGSLVNFQLMIYRGNDTSPSPYTDVWSQFSYGSGKGTQLITFTTTASGMFSLYVEDSFGNIIDGCPYNFSVLSTYLVVENKSSVYGQGLYPSIAGQLSIFFVQLKDINGMAVDGYSETVSAIIDPGKDNEIKVVGSKVLNKTGLYKINVVLNKSGEHDILVLYCNVPLNYARPFKKVVYAGNVSIVKTIVPMDGLVPDPVVSVSHSITIVLRDEYENPVPGQQDQLSIKFMGHVRTPKSSPFQETKTGNYTSTYQAFEVAPMNISIFYRGSILLPGFPFYCYVHSYGWFPRITNDIFWTWEDTAIVMNVLNNDYFGIKPGILLGVQKQPTNGVAYAKGQSIVYVPQKDFIGNDSFLYRVRDSFAEIPNYLHVVTGSVTVYVAKHPPEIISTPNALEACEGETLAIRSGDKTFMIYDSAAAPPIVYAQVVAKYGFVRVIENANLPWTPSTSLSYMTLNQSSENSSNVGLIGVNDVINSALSSLIYIGAPKFHGIDEITLSIKDEVGLGDDASIMMKVKQINHPPYVISYPFILVDAQTGEFLAGIDSTGTMAHNTSLIMVQDEDIVDDTTEVEVSVKVEKGFLIMELPENSAQNTEVVWDSGYYWIPLPTATIENGFFNVQGKCIKFRASVKECNNALRSLSYNGTADGVSLAITVNDMGHYGMDTNCSSKNPYPLSVEKDLNLVFSIPRPESMLQGYRKKMIVRLKVVVSIAGIVTFSFIVVMICLLCFLMHQGKNYIKKIKIYLKQDNDMDTSRVYNAMWIPSAPSSPKREFSNTSNPHHFQLQKLVLREGLMCAEEELKTLLTSQIERNWMSIKSIKRLSFKAN